MSLGGFPGIQGLTKSFVVSWVPGFVFMTFGVPRRTFGALCLLGGLLCPWEDLWFLGKTFGFLWRTSLVAQPAGKSLL